MLGYLTAIGTLVGIRALLTLGLNVQQILVGAILVVLMVRRPEGLLPERTDVV